MPRLKTEEVHEKLRRAFAEAIPGGKTIARRAVARALQGHEADLPERRLLKH